MSQAGEATMPPDLVLRVLDRAGDDVVLIGGQALGGPMIGWLAENIGAQPTMVIAGGVPVLAAGGIAVVRPPKPYLSTAAATRGAWAAVPPEAQRGGLRGAGATCPVPPQRPGFW